MKTSAAADVSGKESRLPRRNTAGRLLQCAEDEKVDEKIVGIIIIFCLALISIGLLFYAVHRMKEKVEYYSGMLFGTSSLSEGIRNMGMEAENAPKSVSSATSLYLPSIVRDFPEFHYEEMKRRAENVLVSYLRSIDAGNAELLTEGTKELKEELNMRIRMLREEGVLEHFEDVRLHRTQIHKYIREKSRCSIIFQSAIQYVHYLEKNGSILEGTDIRPEQSRYDVELIYIQDRNVVEGTGEKGMGLNCPNCGAPVSGLGAKKCAYCDSSIVEFNIRTWNFCRVGERKSS